MHKTKAYSAASATSPLASTTIPVVGARHSGLSRACQRLPAIGRLVFTEPNRISKTSLFTDTDSLTSGRSREI